MKTEDVLGNFKASFQYTKSFLQHCLYNFLIFDFFLIIVSLCSYLYHLECFRRFFEREEKVKTWVGVRSLVKHSARTLRCRVWSLDYQTHYSK